MRPELLRRAALASWLLAVAGPAAAQVLELSPDGELNRVGPGWETARAPASRPDVPAPPAPYRQAVETAARRYDLSPQLLDAVARSESGYDPDAVSPVGAIGVMQLMPATARELGVDPRDPGQNILGGAAYLRAQLDAFDGDLVRALAAYNAGPGQVRKHGGVPPFPETRAYVAANLERLAAAAAAQGESE